MIILKNPQLGSKKADILVVFFTHVPVILTKFHGYRTKIVDFLQWTYSRDWVKFFVTVSIYCSTVQRSKGSGLRHDHLECVCLSVCAAVSSFVKFCNSSPSFISNYHARILFFAKFSRTSRSLFEQSLNKCSNGVCFYKLGCHFGKVFLLDRNLYDLKAVVSEASILKTSSR